MNDQVDLRTLKIDQVYELYTANDPELQEESTEAEIQAYKMMTQKVKYGIRHMFDIRDALTQSRRILIRERVGIVLIYQTGEEIELSEYYDELENRNKAMKKWLETYLGTTKITKPDMIEYV